SFHRGSAPVVHDKTGWPMAELTATAAWLSAAPGLATDLEELITRAAVAWPALTVAHDRMRDALVHAICDLEDPRGALGELFVEDVYLAQACATGAPAALAAFETEHIAGVASALRQLGLAADRVDEVLQDVRARFFVAVEGGAPRIASYSGRASLR